MLLYVFFGFVYCGIAYSRCGKKRRCTFGFFSVAYCGLNARNKHFANLYAAAQHRQYRAARFYFGYFQRLRLYRQRHFHLRLCAHFRNLRLERYNTCMVHLLGGGWNYLSLPLQKQALRQNVKIF